MLAPLEDTSDNALRTLCYKHGADATFTEMTRLDSLTKKNQSTWKKISILNNTPTHIQLAAQKENNLKKFLSTYEPPKGFKGINFNMGCPSPNLISQGLGAALVKRISKMKKIISIVHDYGYTPSVKMRLGLNSYEKEKKIYLNMIDALDVDFIVIHARHAAQTYEELPDYSIFPECVKSGKTIIANGDIDSKEKIEMLKGMGVKGVMIGRYAVRNPAIFNELKGLKTPSIEELRKEYTALADEFNEAYKYRKNVLKRLGKNSSTEQDSEDKEQIFG
jgi:tRNA-dihydrouridine synthase B